MFIIESVHTLGKNAQSNMSFNVNKTKQNKKVRRKGFYKHPQGTK